MDDSFNTVLLAGSALLLVAVVSVRLADRTGLPSLLIYLGVGLAVGEAGLGLKFSDYEITAELGLLALALILAEGGLTTRWSVVRPALPFAVVLATVGVAVSVAVVAGLAHAVLGLDARNSVILGSIVASTDAAAVFSVLRKLPLRARLRSALEAESGLNDAPVVVLVALASSEAWGTTTVLHSAGTVLYELVGGAVLGLVLGRFGRELLSRAALPAAGLYPLATVALCLLTFAAGQELHVSGFLGVYLAALVLGNSTLPHRRAVLGFASSTALLAEAGLFVLLGLLASPLRLDDALPEALLIGAAATFVARPLAVLVSALPFRLPWREQAFLSWAGLRGAVPIVIATIPVNEGLPRADRRGRRRLRPGHRLHARAGADPAVGGPATGRGRSRARGRRRGRDRAARAAAGRPAAGARHPRLPPARCLRRGAAPAAGRARDAGRARGTRPGAGSVHPACAR